jgi:hypothetical protein
MRQDTRRFALLFCLTLCFAVFSSSAYAQTYTVLHNFAGGDGFGPLAGITFDQQGRIYGTTAYGGTHSEGNVYRLVQEGQG